MKIFHLRVRPSNVKTGSNRIPSKEGVPAIPFGQDPDPYPSSQGTQRSQSLNPVLIYPVIRLRNANLDDYY